MDCPGIEWVGCGDADAWEIRCSHVENEGAQVFREVELGLKRRLLLCRHCWMAVTGEVLGTYMVSHSPVVFHESYSI